MKIAYIASSGGHLEQLMMLKPLMDKYECCIITEKTTYKPSAAGHTTYFVPQVNRHEASCVLRLIGISIKSLWIFCKERPDVVISTGALAVIPFCLIAKLFGKKLVFIESFAKVTSGNLTGKFLYRFADRFYVQWESMLKVYPKAQYLGGIY